MTIKLVTKVGTAPDRKNHFMLCFVALTFVVRLWNVVWMVCRDGVSVNEIRGTVTRKEALPSSASLNRSESNQHSKPMVAVTLSKSILTSVRVRTNKDMIDSSTNKSVDPSDAVSLSFSLSHTLKITNISFFEKRDRRIFRNRLLISKTCPKRTIPRTCFSM